MTASISTSSSSPPRRRRLRQLHVLDTTQTGHAGFQYRLRSTCPTVRAAAWRWPSRRTAGCSRWSRPAAMCCAGPPTWTRTPRRLLRTMVKNLGANVAGLTLSSDGKLAFVLGPGKSDSSARSGRRHGDSHNRAACRGEAFVHGAGQQHRAGHARRGRSNQPVSSSRSAAAVGDVDRQRQTRSSAGRARRRCRADTGPTCWKEIPTALFNRSALMRCVQHLAATPGAAVQDRRRQPADRHDRIGQASLHSLCR